ncbi:ABC transporter ATP-binding protein [Rubrimonas sp.]|uniref:ABC transporter ATP-binding protein n=1 Tax=Rubrimonas sp. TaxID=2036015 RepID=UPI002FDD9D60
MTTVALEAVTVRFGATLALDAIDCDAPSGRLTALLGPSGCGKSSALRAVAGFAPITGGTVRFGGVDVTRVPPEARPSAMVFQSYALWPHMTVAQNIGFGLRLKGMTSAERRRRTDRVLEMVGLAGFGGRRPDALSGGQRQRVALARALALEPKVLLLDEPMSNLDAGLRAQTQTEIRRLQTALGLTVLLVTHDQDEAMAMADRVALMREGRIVQAGAPEDLYERPESRFAAGFVGRTNFLPARIVGRSGVAVEIEVLGRRLTGVAAADLAPGAHEAVAGVRPDALGLCAEGDDALSVHVLHASYHGAYRTLHATVAGQAVDIDLPSGAPLPAEPKLVLPCGPQLRAYAA